MRLRVALLLLTVVGCKKSDDAKKSPDPKDPGTTIHLGDRDRKPEPPGTANPQSKLTATIDGKPVTFQSAFAWQQDGTIRLWVSNMPSSCEHATADMKEIAHGEESWDAILSKKLQKDASFSWAVQQVSYGANTKAGGLGATTVTGDASAGSPTMVTMSFEQDSMAFGDQKQEHLKVDGTVTAIGCASPPPRADSAAKPPPPAQGGNLTVAGQKVAIHGAVMQEDASGERTIVLSSGGASCDGGFAQPDDADVALYLHYQAKGDDVWEVELQGNWIDGDQASQIFDKGKLVVTPTHVPPGATTVDLALGGSTDVMDFPVAIDGKVTAQVCPPK